MSRSYKMQVKIEKYIVKKIPAIREACCSEWDFESIREYPHNKTKYLWGHGEDQLYGGECENEFAARLSQAIWKANGKFCRIEVVAIYLEASPTEVYVYEKTEYEKWKQ